MDQHGVLWHREAKLVCDGACFAWHWCAGAACGQGAGQ